MPKTRKQKELVIENISKNISKAKSIVFVGFSGLSVVKLMELRRLMRKENVMFSVVKKTLMRKALEQSKLNVEEEIFKDKSIFGIVIGMGDDVAPSKIVYDFAKKEMADNKNFKMNLVGGFLAGNFLTSQAVNELGKLPSKEQLITQLVCTIAAPLKNLLYVFSAAKEKVEV